MNIPKPRCMSIAMGLFLLTGINTYGADDVSAWTRVARESNLSYIIKHPEVVEAYLFLRGSCGQSETGACKKLRDDYRQSQQKLAHRKEELAHRKGQNEIQEKIIFEQLKSINTLKENCALLEKLKNKGNQFYAEELIKQANKIEEYNKNVWRRQTLNGIAWGIGGASLGFFAGLFVASHIPQNYHIVNSVMIGSTLAGGALGCYAGVKLAGDPVPVKSVSILAETINAIRE